VAGSGRRATAALLVDGLNDPARGALSFTSEELIFNFCFFFKFWSASYDVTKHKRRRRIKGLPTDVNTNHFCPVCWIGVYQVIS
jgi:hypothetical protein